MSRDELLAPGRELIVQARALRAAFPHPEAMAAIDASDMPGRPPEPNCPYWEAFQQLRNEMLVARAGKTSTLGVLDDELAGAELALACLAAARIFRHQSGGG